jgi:Uma2 family endonuclease
MATATEPLAFKVGLETMDRVVLRPGREFTDDGVFDFCQHQHKLLRIERNADGEISIMPPVGYEGTFAEGRVYDLKQIYDELDA